MQSGDQRKAPSNESALINIDSRFQPSNSPPRDPSQSNLVRADLHPAIAANPFLTFFTVATESGTIELAWTDDHNETQTQKADIVVE